MQNWEMSNSVKGIENIHMQRQGGGIKNLFYLPEAHLGDAVRPD
jgi:hypothetical protein